MRIQRGWIGVVDPPPLKNHKFYGFIGPPQNLNPQKMALAYVYYGRMRVHSPPPPPPPSLCPLPLSFAVFWFTFQWVASWSFEPDFGSTEERYTIRSMCVLIIHQTFCPLHIFTVHICFVPYTSVTHMATSVSWPFFGRYLFFTYALLMRFMRSLTFHEDPLCHRNDFNRQMNTR